MGKSHPSDKAPNKTAQHKNPLRYSIPPLPEPFESDFRAFLALIWQHLNLPRPTPVQLDIASYMQNGPDRQVDEAFRGVGKSWIASAFVVWCLRKWPWLKFLIVSASKDRADNFTTFTLRLINEIPILQCLRPQADQRCSKVSFDVGPALADHAPSVTSKGITSQLAGSRANIIISDDVEVPNNSMTQGQRDKLAEAVKEYDAILKPGGRIIYLGTPQTELSLYNQLPARGYAVRIWPARFPTEKQVENYMDKLAPAIKEALDKNPALVGRSTDPLRFSDEDLMARELSYGRAGFALQFMLDPALSDCDRYPLRLSDLIVMDTAPDEAPEKVLWCSSPEKRINDLPNVGLQGDCWHLPMKVWDSWLPYAGAVMSIDPSGRGKDETGYAVVKQLNGYLYLTAAGGLKDGYSPDSLMTLAQTAKAEKVKEIVIESNFGDGMFSELLKPYLAKVGYPVTISEVRNSVQKEKRICDTLEPVFAQHRLIVNKKLIQEDFEGSRKMLGVDNAYKYQLFYQISRITRDKGALAHDDRLDALSLAVGYWTAQMSIDADIKVREQQEELLLKELETWMGDISGLSTAPGGFGFDMAHVVGVGTTLNDKGKCGSALMGNVGVGGGNRPPSSFGTVRGR